MAGPSSLVTSLLGKLRRDRSQPVRVLLQKSAMYARDLASAPVFLRAATSLGPRPRTRGRPFVENLGRLVIGRDFQLVSRWVQSHLVTGPKGELRIGDDVNINFGAAISAQESVTIGSRVRMGPYAIVMDSDFHSSTDRDASASAPIVIEDDVWLAARVTVLKGSRIGKGSVIGANSVVSGEIPPGVVAVGVPARPVRRLTPGESAADASTASVAPAPAPVAAVTTPSSSAPTDASVQPRVEAVVRKVFGWTGPLDRASGPESVTGWDSLGHVRLVQALEDEFGHAFAPADVISLTSVGSITDALSRGP